MRKPINYKPGEAIEGKWKQELLIYLGKQFDLRTLFETGTCDGGTLAGVHSYFDYNYSIELSDYYFEKAEERFKNCDDVFLFKGNSAIVLKEIIQFKNDIEILTGSPDLKNLFWLDAHPSGGKTANEGDPLPEEIKAIVELSPNSLVVIDDHNSASEVKNKVIEAGIDLTGWTLEFRTGLVFLYKDGLYKIPEFE